MILETAYPDKIGPFLLSVSNLFLRRKPHEIGRLLALSIVLYKVTYEGNPRLIGPIRFQQHSITNPTLEFSNSRADDIIARQLPSLSIALRRITGALGGLVAVDPFPGDVVVAELVVGILARNTWRGSLASSRGRWSLGRHWLGCHGRFIASRPAPQIVTRLGDATG